MKKPKKAAAPVEPVVVHVEPVAKEPETPRVPQVPQSIPEGYIWDNSSSCFKKNGP